MTLSPYCKECRVGVKSGEGVSLLSGKAGHKMDIEPIVDKYISSDKLEREKIKQYIRENWKLGLQCIGMMDYSARESVRQKSKEILIKGLYANTLDEAPQDPRDNISCLTKLYHSAIMLGLNPEEEFLKVANDTEGNGKKLLISFANGEPKSKTLRGMGYRTTQTPDFNYISDSSDEYLFVNQYSEETDKKIIGL